VSIRTTGGDDDLAPVIRAAFGGREHGDDVAAIWAEVVRDGLDLASLVAEADGELVGHVGVSRAWLDARRALVDVWMLSPLSVLPDRQRGGIGTALLAAAVDAARAGGAPLLVLEGSPTYYGSRGFDRASRHGIRPASTRTPDAACQVVLFDAHEEWMTGQVIYRDVWWRYDAAGLRDPRLADLEARFATLDEGPENRSGIEKQPPGPAA
jgi:putative acetyltransferase